MTCSSCGSALKIDPLKMARVFSRKLSNWLPVQKNGSKTWTGELLDTLQVLSPVFPAVFVTCNRVCMFVCGKLIAAIIVKCS